MRHHEGSNRCSVRVSLYVSLLFVVISGCHRSSSLGGDGGIRGPDVLDSRDAPTLDAGARDSGFDADAEFADAEFDSEPEVDARERCPTASTVQSFHSEEDERRFASELALSGDGSTLAVTSDDALSIYDRRDDDWALAYRRTVLLTGSGVHSAGGVDIDDAGDTLVWGSNVSTDDSPDYSAALVFERDAMGEWRETTLAASPDTFELGSGVAVSGDGSTLAIREERGVDVTLTLYERRDLGEWARVQTLVERQDSSIRVGAVELSYDGSDVVWQTRSERFASIYRKDESGLWIHIFTTAAGPQSFAFDEAGSRLVVRITEPDMIFVYDQEGEDGWSDARTFVLPEPALLVPPYVAISPAGDEIYASNSTSCGVTVWSWTARGANWVEGPTRYVGVDSPARASRYPLSVASDGTIALGVHGNGNSGDHPPEDIGVYLLRE